MCVFELVIIFTSRASTDDYDSVLGLICEEEPHAVGKVSGGDKGLEHL